MKEIFLELLKPCCRFSFESLRKFINSVVLKDENVRQSILNGIKIDGNLTPIAWNLFIENAKFDLLLTDEMLRTWIEGCFDLSCERWEYLIKHVLYLPNFEVSYNDGFEGQFLINAGKIGRRYISIDTAEDLKEWLMFGIDDFEGLNDLTNVEILDFKKEYNPNHTSYNLKCILFADGENIQFSQIFNRVDKFGEIKGLKTLKMYYNEVNYFTIKNEAETLETIYIEGLYDLQTFDTEVELKSLKDLQLINVNQLNKFDPSKTLSSLEKINITASNLTKFTPTRPLSKLKEIKLQRHQIDDWSFTNWVSHLPKGGKFCISSDVADFETSLTKEKLVNKLWTNVCNNEKDIYLYTYATKKN